MPLDLDSLLKSKPATDPSAAPPIPKQCPKCQGFLVDVVLSDDHGTGIKVTGRRCINCGWIYDPIMEANRTRPPKRATSRTSLF